MTDFEKPPAISPKNLLNALGRRNIVFVGLMGAGKTSIGRRVAARLGIPFFDSDHEIEGASRMTIPELFETYGETEFRALEERVLHRLLSESPRVISTGGGAFMNPAIRGEISATSLSVWLDADLDVLMERVKKRQNRPLLKADDPVAVMKRLMKERYPVYASADIVVKTRDAHRDIIAEEVLQSLDAFLCHPQISSEEHSRS